MPEDQQGWLRTISQRGANSRDGSSPLRWHRPFELEFLDAIADLIAIEAEQRRRFRLVPAAPFERLHDQRPLELFQLDPRCRQLHAFGDSGDARPAWRELIRVQLVAFGEKHRAFHDIPQLADVAGPPVRLQPAHRLVADAANPLLELDVEQVDEEMDQRRDVIRARAQWWQHDGQDVQPVIQVLAETPLL